MGAGGNGDEPSEGMSILRLIRVLDAEPRYKVGYHRWKQDSDCRIPPSALLHQETESAARSPGSGDGYTGPYRFDVRICGEQTQGAGREGEVRSWWRWWW